jgi:hypothetical protein
MDRAGRAPLLHGSLNVSSEVGMEIRSELFYSGLGPMMIIGPLAGIL